MNTIKWEPEKFNRAHIGASVDETIRLSEKDLAPIPVKGEEIISLRPFFMFIEQQIPLGYIITITRKPGNYEGKDAGKSWAIEIVIRDPVGLQRSFGFTPEFMEHVKPEIFELMIREEFNKMIS